MSWVPEPAAAASASRIADVMRNLAIAQVVIGVLQIVLSFGYIDAALGIACGATVLQAYNSSNDIVVRSRALRNTCFIGVAIAELVFAVLSVLVWASVFFTVGILFYAVVGVINNLQSGNSNLTPEQTKAFNFYCSNGYNACAAVKGTFAWAATWFLFSWLLPLIQIFLTAIVMCQHNAISSLVTSKLTPPSNSGGATVVMMPAGMVMQPGVQVVSGGMMIGGGGQVMMVGGGQPGMVMMPQGAQVMPQGAYGQQTGPYGQPVPQAHVPTAQPVAYAQPVAQPGYNPASQQGAYGMPTAHPVAMPVPLGASDVPNKSI